MGIDIGDLDEVVLIQSPPSIAAALQRIGAGRAPRGGNQSRHAVSEPRTRLPRSRRDRRCGGRAGHRTAQALDATARRAGAACHLRHRVGDLGSGSALSGACALGAVCRACPRAFRPRDRDAGRTLRRHPRARPAPAPGLRPHRRHGQPPAKGRCSRSTHPAARSRIAATSRCATRTRARASASSTRSSCGKRASATPSPSAPRTGACSASRRATCWCKPRPAK